MKGFVYFILMMVCVDLSAQNKMGFTWIVGNNAAFGKFDGSSSNPQFGQKFSPSNPNFPFVYFISQSNICDTLSGEIIMSTTGMILYDSLGNIVENGDSLQPFFAYTHNNPPSLAATQGSLILPKGNNNEYYVFIPTVSDSLYSILWTNPNGTKAPFDMLRYNVVDMKLNGGSGKVVQKNRVLLKGIELSKVMMQACRHSNGVDWWLLKPSLNDNTIYRFLVTKDSIYGPYIQSFSQPKWGWYDLHGQSAFSKDGTKYGAVMGKSGKLFLADFDRCTGELSNPKTYNIPIDSTTIPFWDDQNSFDTISSGICFSNNGNYLYISKPFNIYQFEFNQPDSSLAWYRVKHGADTSNLAFEYYGHLYRAPNNRIYIGKWGGSLTQFSVIDNPDNKGAACNFCRKCFRIDNAVGGLTTPPNMPDYELGTSGVICWPLSNNEISYQEKLLLYPNPANDNLTLEAEFLNHQDNEVTIYNLVGQKVLSQNMQTRSGKIQIDIQSLTNGVYSLRVGSSVQRFLKE